ncbi:MAG: hypothetical protein ACRD0C_07205 [Acidimicrobiia bacterium]
MLVVATAFAGVSAHGSGAAEPPTTSTTGRATPTTSTEPSTTTTTVVAPETTTTTAAPPEATTTTTAPPETPTTTTAPAPRERRGSEANALESPAAGPLRQEQIEAIADASGWDWRAAGVILTVGYFPGDCCHWGVYESERRTVWIGPSAFANPVRLRYVVLHELAHGWQYTRNRFTELIADYRPFGMATPADALEAGGDCIATLWGAADHHYWACPAAAQQVAARRLAGNWS